MPQVKVIDPVKQRAVYEETMKELDKFENDGLPQVTVDTTEILFGEVHFYESKTQTLTITNTGRVREQGPLLRGPALAGVCRSGESSPSKHVQVFPNHGAI